MALPKPDSPDRVPSAYVDARPRPTTKRDRIALEAPHSVEPAERRAPRAVPAQPADDDAATPSAPAATTSSSGSAGYGSLGPGFQIQLAKVQRPPLRAETLTRQRLLSWLEDKMDHRLVFVTAEAGHGKTTLLADYARHSRRRILWYRLDEQDRDWISVLNYLVAAGRQVKPEFAMATGALLGDMATGRASRERIVEAFMLEVQALDDVPTAVIFDDWHLLDSVADVRDLMRELIQRAPAQMTFLFASRRRPSIPIARYRARGEVAELATKDLRFSPPETEQLFREAYGHPLEPDVLADLSSRTEGWAASLQLAQAALRDRSPAEIRSFVRGLSGIDEDLYDYLAEEVVADLDDDMQAFLMRTSILQVVDPAYGAVVAGVSEEQARLLIESAEKVGLLARRGELSRHTQRFHPLVRDFLVERLVHAMGDAAVAELHLAVARFAEGSNWQRAAYHYAEAGHIADVHRVIESSVLEIMSAGDYAAVAAWMDRYPPDTPAVVHSIVRSRVLGGEDQVEDSIRLAKSAVEAAACRDPRGA